jgi:hypothetical protein
VVLPREPLANEGQLGGRLHQQRVTSPHQGERPHEVLEALVDLLVQGRHGRRFWRELRFVFDEEDLGAILTEPAGHHGARVVRVEWEPRASTRGESPFLLTLDKSGPRLRLVDA